MDFEDFKGCCLIVKGLVYLLPVEDMSSAGEVVDELVEAVESRRKELLLRGDF